MTESDADGRGDRDRPLRFAVPKGSLEEATAKFLARAGLALEGYGEGARGYRPKTDMSGVEVKVLRPQEIPVLLSRGYYDLGISGIDWYTESRCERNVEELVDLGFGKVKLVLAVPEGMEGVESAADFFKKHGEAEGSRPLRIWTEYLNIAEDFVFRYENVHPAIVSPHTGMSGERHSDIEIFQSFGATESKPPEDGDAIIDVTETGRTLRANGLKIVQTVLSSTARLLANRRSLLDEGKRERIAAIRSACERAAAPSAAARKRTFEGHLDF